MREAGELDAIRALMSTLGRMDDVKVGPGDDCAVVEAEGSPFDWLYTTDPVIEGVHFRRGDDPRRVGHKAAGRVLSDIAAMGGEPLWLLINVVAPPSAKLDRLKAIYRGATRLCRKYGASIIGGDMAEGPKLELHVFGMGRAPADSAVLRRGARAGDRIYVTGALGGSRTGKHLDFEPRITEGLWLRESGWPTAMIDISDGLATDLRHILDRSRVGARIDTGRIPIAAPARRSRTPVEKALMDGEDFELLFTVPAGKSRLFESAWKDAFTLPCTAIGEILSGRNQVQWIGKNGKLLSKGVAGYEHYRRR